MKRKDTHQVELGDDRGIAFDGVELAVPVKDVDVLFRGATFLDVGGFLKVARTVSSHTWLVRPAEGLSDRHQLALK